MNTQVANQLETQNTGEYIHCHFQNDSETWIAFGKSAYGLQYIVDNSKVKTLYRYNPDIKMASVMVGKKIFDNLCRNQSITISKENSKYVCIDNNSSFDNASYNAWVEEIKSQSTQKGHMWVSTNVSKALPSTEFIPDGMSAFARNTKRILDCLISAIALVIFSPLFLLTYILVKAEDGGPAIFRQARIGRFGRPFYIYKFRSMRIDAEKFGPQLSSSGGANDPRLTKIGKFIRAHHLDELPQLWNVFIGDMSFIGPRPERKFYIDLIMQYDKRYVCLYQIRPGVTSYATLYNGYTDTMEKMLRRLEYDLYYLGHRSWWFDIKVLLNTFCSIMFGKKF